MAILLNSVRLLSLRQLPQCVPGDSPTPHLARQQWTAERPHQDIQPLHRRHVRHVVEESGVRRSRHPPPVRVPCGRRAARESEALLLPQPTSGHDRPRSQVSGRGKDTISPFHTQITIIHKKIRTSQNTIYTIILLKSVAVRKLQVAIFARSSLEISLTE